jgi:hypothetical protein
MHILSNTIQVKAGTTQGIQFEVETTKKRHFLTHLSIFFKIIKIECQDDLIKEF